MPIALLLAAALADVVTPPDAKAAEQYMYQCEREWAAIPLTGGTAPIDRCIADDAAQVSSTGLVRSKAELKKPITAYATAAGLGDVSIKWLSPDLAVVIGKSWSEHGGGREWTIFTDTWQRRKGQWQIVFTHSAAWQPPAAATPAVTGNKP